MSQHVLNTLYPVNLSRIYLIQLLIPLQTFAPKLRSALCHRLVLISFHELSLKIVYNWSQLCSIACILSCLSNMCCLPRLLLVVLLLFACSYILRTYHKVCSQFPSLHIVVPIEVLQSFGGAFECIKELVFCYLTGIQCIYVYMRT